MKFNRRLAFLLAVLISLSSFCVVFASAEETSETTSSSETVSVKPDIAEVNSAIAYSLADDQFLYTDGADNAMPPSVATKLMTVMVATDIFKEHGRKAEDIEVIYTEAMKKNAGSIIDFRVPMKGLSVGTGYSAKDLIGYVLIAGHNDAAVALAYYCGEAYLDGGLTEFVERMNAKAAELGLEKTVFLNPTGADAPGQTSTLREIAMIAKEFYSYNELVTIADSSSYSGVHSRNFLKNDRYLKGFLNTDAIGIAAGQLDKNGNYCLIAASQKEGRTYLFVVASPLGIKVETVDGRNYYSLPEGNAYYDMSNLIKWTRDSFKLISVAKTTDIIGELRVNLGSSSDHVMIVPETDSEKLVLNVEGGELTKTVTYNTDLVYKRVYENNEWDTMDAPVSAGQIVGTVTYYYNGAELVTLNAVTMTSIESDSVKAWLDNAKNFLFGDFMKTVIWILVIVVVGYAVISIVGIVYRFVNNMRPDQPAKKKKKPNPSPAKREPKKEKDSSQPPKNENDQEENQVE